MMMQQQQQQKKRKLQQQSSSSWARNSNSNSNSNNKIYNRIVLLFDLDCFYAQCECVRLGYDVVSTSLALLQWNSVLAVTYPARTWFGIKRGDSWDEIQRKVNQYNSNNNNINNNNNNNNNTNCSSNNNAKCNSDVNNDTNNETTTTTRKECYSIHVPLLRTSSSLSAPKQENNETTTASSVATRNAISMDRNDHNDDDVVNTTTTSNVIMDEYDQVFQLSKEEQMTARRMELGVRHYSTEGKASIERYRIASRKIFATVSAWIDEAYPSDHDHNHNHNIVLERASIDEFFLDVSHVCWNNNNNNDIKEDDIQNAMSNTKVVGQQHDNKNNNHDNDYNYNNIDQLNHNVAWDGNNDPDGIIKAHQIGCYIANSIRQRVFEKLGFTMSAGISYNKTLAKLSTTYGKPNGQAVTYPHAGTEYLLNDTEIRKCRNLGGKLGKRIAQLLPPNAPQTVGAIAKYLSLPDLHKGLAGSMETAQWVYKLSRGIDHEAVLSKNESGMPKSITCFKALPFIAAGHTLDDAAPWIKLLAQEVVSRVDNDALRHHRYPKTCTVCYAQDRNRDNKSIRMNFPSERLPTQDAKVDYLIEHVPKLICTKERKDEFRCTRIGLCAVDFVARVNTTNAIESYFSSVPPPSSIASKQKQPPEPVPTTTEIATTTSGTDPETATIPKSSVAGGPFSSSEPSSSSSIVDVPIHRHPSPSTTGLSSDLEMAKKLQAGFNSECRLLEALDKKKKQPCSSSIRRKSKDKTGVNKPIFSLLQPKTLQNNNNSNNNINCNTEVVDLITIDQGTSKTPERSKEIDIGVDVNVANQNAVLDIPAILEEGLCDHHPDLILAKKLQAEYDRENRRGVLMLDTRVIIDDDKNDKPAINNNDKNKKQQRVPSTSEQRLLPNSNDTTSSSNSKTRRIDTFFHKR